MRAKKGRTPRRRRLLIESSRGILAIVAVVAAICVPLSSEPLPAQAEDTPPAGVCLRPTAGEVNTSWPLTAEVRPGDTTLTVSTVATDQVGAYGEPRFNDLFLISQVMDATINTTNTSNYGSGKGTGNGYISLGQSGIWEYARVQSYDSDTGVVTLQAPVTGTYHTTGTSRAQVTRVPEFVNLTLRADVTAPSVQVVSGDRVAGGVVAVVVSGKLDLNGYSIHADSLGFLGGAGVKYKTFSTAGTEYVLNSVDTDGGKGLSIAATPVDLQNTLGGAYGQGAPANGGGGGGDVDGPGAGGGNGGVGGSGGPPWAGNANAVARAVGGAAIPVPAGETLARRLIMGGGGGGGNGNDGTQTRGGQGGGVVVVDAATITNSGATTAGKGEIRANGQDSLPSSGDASGGGGAAGTVVVRSGSAVPATVDLIAKGGGTSSSQNTGSAGGGGRIVSSITPAGTVSAAKGSTSGTGTGPAGDGLTAVATIPQPPTAPPTPERSCDFGDLPDLSSGTATGDYQTLAANGYAVHYGVGVRLGADRDSEAEAHQNADASGDAGDDGVTLSYIPRNSSTLTVSVSVQNVTKKACLVGYLDANSDGDFADTGESSAGVSNITADGSQNLVFTNLSGLSTLGQRIALRVRVSSDTTFCAAPRTGGALSVGYAGSGEIEDYRLSVAVATDLSITKELVAPTTGTIVPGAPVSWAVTVRNGGSAAVISPGFAVKDTIPTGFTGTWTCSVASGTATCPTTLSDAPPHLDADIVALSVGAELRFTFTGTASSTLPLGNVTNAATVTSNGFEMVDTNPANNSAEATSPVQGTADLQAAKLATTASVNAGEEASFTLSATNNGPHTASTVTLADSLPPGYTATSLSTTREGASCDLAGLTCSVPSLPVGETFTATLVAHVPAEEPAGTDSNSMVVSSSTTDPNSANNTATAPVTITRAFDMEVELSAATAVAGKNASVLVTATNHGPSKTESTVTVPVPSGLTFNAGASSSGCTATDGVVSCATGRLAPDKSANFTLVFSIPAGTPAGTIATSARVSTPTADTNPDNDTDANVITVTTSANLGVEKELLAEPIVAGGTSEWRITVHNAGPSTATGVSIVDQLPTGLTVTAIAAPDGVSCNQAELTCSTDSLAPGQSIEVTLTTKLDGATPEGTRVENTATVSSRTSDPDEANNSSSSSGTTAIDARISISKRSSPATVNAGENAVYTLTVSNDGASQNSGVQIVDTLPAGITVDGTITSTGDATCEVTQVEGRPTVSCAADTLDSGEKIVVTVPVAVDPNMAAGTVTNSASVTTETASATISSGLTVKRDADVGVTKQLAEPGAKAPGEEFEIVLTAKNFGPSTANNVVVVDNLPARMSFLRGEGCTAEGSQITCTATSIAPGVSVSFPVTVITAPRVADGTVVNKAAVSATEADSVAENNDVSLQIEMARRAELTLAKTDSVDPARAGGTFSYTLAVTNAGPSVADGVEVTDTLPAGITFVPTGSTSSCTAAEPNATGQVVTCALDDTTINVGQTVKVGIAVTAAAGIAPGTQVTNTASVTGAGAENNEEDNAASEDTLIDARADLSVTKSVVSEQVVPGSLVVWQIEVTNAGPSMAQDVVITDPLDSRVSFVADDPNAEGTESSPECSADQGRVTCDLGAVAVDSKTVQVVGRIAADATGELRNTATLTTTTVGTCLGAGEPCDSTTTSTLQPQASISVEKTVESDTPLVPGTIAIFGVTVTNAGPSAASEVEVTDTLPAGLTFVAADSSEGCSADGQDVTCSVGAVAVTETTVLIAARIDPDLRGSISNTAGASTPADPECSPEVPCLDSVGPVDLSPQAHLEVTKSTSTSPIIAGGLVTFDIAVQNTGPSDATSVVVTDRLAAGMTFVEASEGCSADRQEVTCAGVTIAAGAEISRSITVRLAPGHDDSLENVAVATSPDDPDCTQGCSGVLPPTDVTRAADLVVDSSNPTVVPGATGTVTFTVTNAGPSDVPGALTVTFSVPDKVTVSEPPAGCVAVAAGKSYRCTIDGPLATSDDVTLDATVTVDADATGDDDLTGGSVTVSSETPETNIANNVDTFVVSAGPRNAQLEVTKKLTSTPLIAGGANSFTVTITNRGLSIATDIELTDTLSDAFTFDPETSTAGCAAAGQQVSCQLDSIGVGTTEVTIGVIASHGVRAEQSNTVTVKTDTDGNCTAGCTATAGPYAPVQVADLTIIKEIQSAPVIPGDRVRWTVTVRNNGPSDATSVLVTDDLDPRLAFVAFDPAAATSSSEQCTASAGRVSCEVGTLAPGAAAELSVVALLDAEATGSLTNVATVTSPDDPECVAGCDSEPETSSIAQLAQLTVEKRLVSSALIPGQPAVWEVVVHNAGPSAARGLTVTDDLDPRLVFVPHASGDALSSSEGCTETDGTVTCAAAEGAVGDTVFRIVTRVQPDARGSIGNTAVVTATTFPSCFTGCEAVAPPQPVQLAPIPPDPAPPTPAPTPPAPAPPIVLPITGAGIPVGQAILGAGLILAGAVTVLTRRRRAR